MGCGTTLFVGTGGYITCSHLECPAPDAVSTILDDRETQHIVLIEETTFSLQHPLRERLDGNLFSCDIHQQISEMSGPPVRPGRYRTKPNGGGGWSWERLGDL